MGEEDPATRTPSLCWEFRKNEQEIWSYPVAAEYTNKNDERPAKKRKEAGTSSTRDVYILTVPTDPTEIPYQSPYQFRLYCGDTPSWKITLDGKSLERLNRKDITDLIGRDRSEEAIYLKNNKFLKEIEITFQRQDIRDNTQRDTQFFWRNPEPMNGEHPRTFKYFQKEQSRKSAAEKKQHQLFKFADEASKVIHTRAVAASPTAGAKEYEHEDLFVRGTITAKML